MSAWRAELTTKEQVIAFYENSPLVRYKVYAGNKPDRTSMRWEFDGEDKRQGLYELNLACDAILANPANINSYTLQLVRSDKVIRLGEHKAAKRVEDAINIVFQLNFQNSVQPIQPMQMGAVASPQLGNLERLLEKQIEQTNAMMSMLMAKVESDANEIEEESIGASVQERLLEPVFNLLENPIITNAIAEKISGWLMPNNKPIAMAGISKDFASSQDDKIDKAIEILHKYDPTLGDDLLKLAAIAEKDVNQFNTLLMVLRTQ